MRGEINFQKYSSEVGEGLFADNVILSLIGFKENKVLSAEEKEVLKKAKKFIDDVIEGERLQKDVIRSAHDINVSKVYISVQPIMVQLSKLEELRDTIEGMINNQTVNTQKVDQLDNFFTSYSRIKFQKAQSVLEAV